MRKWDAQRHGSEELQAAGMVQKRKGGRGPDLDGGRRGWATSGHLTAMEKEQICRAGRRWQKLAADPEPDTGWRALRATMHTGKGRGPGFGRGKTTTTQLFWPSASMRPLPNASLTALASVDNCSGASAVPKIRGALFLTASRVCDIEKIGRAHV